MSKRRRCPHGNVAYCPLYWGMHIAGAPSCVSNRLDEGLCAVDLGADYEALAAAFRAQRPRDAAECEFAEATARAKQKSKANMRAAGLH